jgi:hypothetical protein
MPGRIVDEVVGQWRVLKSGHLLILALPVPIEYQTRNVHIAEFFDPLNKSIRWHGHNELCKFRKHRRFHHF